MHVADPERERGGGYCPDFRRLLRAVQREFLYVVWQADSSVLYGGGSPDSSADHCVVHDRAIFGGNRRTGLFHQDRARHLPKEAGGRLCGRCDCGCPSVGCDGGGRCRNYITAIAEQLPLLLAGIVFGILFLRHFTEITGPRWAVFAVGIFWLLAGGVEPGLWREGETEGYIRKICDFVI